MCSKFIPMKTALVYTLTDPRNNEVRYVGVTIQKLQARLRGHLRYKGKDHRTAWVQSLLREGVIPVIDQIDVVPIEDRGEAEQRWIAIYRERGADLTNGTDGGLGCLGYKHTDEARSKMSQDRKGRPSPNKGKSMPAEQRELLRQATLRQYEQDPQKREKVSQTHKGKTISAEHRAAISAGATRKWQEWRESGQQISEETREKIRRAAKTRPPRKPISEETRARMAEARRLYWERKRQES